MTTEVWIEKGDRVCRTGQAPHNKVSTPSRCSAWREKKNRMKHVSVQLKRIACLWFERYGSLSGACYALGIQ